MRWLIVGVVILISFMAAMHAVAQHSHDQHHSFYQNWINGNGHGCCNDRDCGELAESAERVRANGIEVRVDGEWCPVYSWHYLKRGNAPDATKAHVCVLRKTANDTRPVCSRFVCYQPKPLT